MIYPRVVGTSIGLPPIWVLLSIILCGNLFGIVGILLGIPTFSVLYTLLRESVRRRLYKKGFTKEQMQFRGSLEKRSDHTPKTTSLETDEECPQDR